MTAYAAGTPLTYDGLLAAYARADTGYQDSMTAFLATSDIAVTLLDAGHPPAMTADYLQVMARDLADARQHLAQVLKAADLITELVEERNRA